MIEKIWNPQTTGQKLMSRFFLPVGLRDGASRQSRTWLSFFVTITAVAMYAQKVRIKQLEERLEHSIEIPPVKLPTFSFSSIK